MAERRREKTKRAAEKQKRRKEKKDPRNNKDTWSVQAVRYKAGTKREGGPKSPIETHRPSPTRRQRKLRRVLNKDAFLDAAGALLLRLERIVRHVAQLRRPCLSARQELEGPVQLYRDVVQRVCVNATRNPEGRVGNDQRVAWCQRTERSVELGRVLNAVRLVGAWHAIVVVDGCVRRLEQCEGEEVLEEVEMEHVRQSCAHAVPSVARATWSGRRSRRRIKK